MGIALDRSLDDISTTHPHSTDGDAVPPPTADIDTGSKGEVPGGEHQNHDGDDPDDESVRAACDHLYDVGTLCEVQAVIPTTKGSWLLLVKGLERVKRLRVTAVDPLTCDATLWPDEVYSESTSEELGALVLEVRTQLDALRS